MKNSTKNWIQLMAIPVLITCLALVAIFDKGVLGLIAAAFAWFIFMGGMVLARRWGKR